MADAAVDPAPKDNDDDNIVEKLYPQVVLKFSHDKVEGERVGVNIDEERKKVLQIAQ